MRRLALELGRPRQGVEPWIGLAAGEGLGHEDVDGDAVLGVHHDHRPGLVGRLHGSQDLPVVGVQDARVGHEQLEAGDPLVVHEVRHRLERLLVDAADDLVEAVVDGAVAVGLLVPAPEGVLHAAARVLHGEVDDRRDAAPRGGDRPGLERVARLGAAEGHLHVRVHVDAARHDVLAGGVDRRVGGDPQGIRLPWGQDRRDRLAVDQHVGGRAAARADDGAARDEGGRRHCVPPATHAVAGRSFAGARSLATSDAAHASTSSPYASGRRSR